MFHFLRAIELNPWTLTVRLINDDPAAYVQVGIIVWLAAAAFVVHRLWAERT